MSVNKGKIAFSPDLFWNSKIRMQTALEIVSGSWGKEILQGPGHQDGGTGTNTRMEAAGTAGI